MKATARQIEKFVNTVRHSAEHQKCLYAANNVMRLKAKLDALGFDTQAVLDRYDV